MCLSTENAAEVFLKLVYFNNMEHGVSLIFRTRWRSLQDSKTPLFGIWKVHGVLHKHKGPNLSWIWAEMSHLTIGSKLGFNCLFFYMHIYMQASYFLTSLDLWDDRKRRNISCQTGAKREVRMWPRSTAVFRPELLCLTICIQQWGRFLFICENIFNTDSAMLTNYAEEEMRDCALWHWAN